MAFCFNCVACSYFPSTEIMVDLSPIWMGLALHGEVGKRNLSTGSMKYLQYLKITEKLW